MTATIRLQREPFDAAREVAELTRGRTDIGAVVTFTGICRGDEEGVPLWSNTQRNGPPSQTLSYAIPYVLVVVTRLNWSTMLPLRSTSHTGSPQFDTKNVSSSLL